MAIPPWKRGLPKKSPWEEKKEEELFGPLPVPPKITDEEDTEPTIRKKSPLQKKQEEDIFGPLPPPDELEEKIEEQKRPYYKKPGYYYYPEDSPYYELDVSPSMKYLPKPKVTYTPRYVSGVAGRRARGIVTTFEEEHQPLIQDYFMERYNYYHWELQMSREHAETRARQDAEERYEQMWIESGVETEMKGAYGEIYGEHGYTLVEQPDGTYAVIPTKDYEYMQRKEQFVTEYTQKERGPWEQVQHVVDLVRTAIMYPDIAGEAMHRAYVSRDYISDVQRDIAVSRKQAEGMFRIQEAWAKEGAVGYFKDVFSPKSLIVSLPLAYGAGRILGTGFGIASKLIGKAATRAAQITMGTYFGYRAVTEQELLLTTGRAAKYGGLFGLLVVGPKPLKEGQRPLTPEERYSQLMTFGMHTVATVVGYTTGFKHGQQIISKYYQPKYIQTQYMYPRLQKIAETDAGILFKGKITYRATQVRTIFGKKVPLSKTIYTTELPVKGILAKKQVSLVTDAGSAVWKAGEAWYILGKGTLSMKALGLTKKIKYPGGDIYKAHPARPIKVDVGKELAIAIQPYAQKTPLGTLYVDKPIASLLLTKKLLKTPIFKPDVKSRYYPGESIIKESKGITQIWELKDAKAVMKIPHIEKVKVKYYQYGEPVAGKKGEITSRIYGFTKMEKPEIYVREPPPKGDLPVDMFGRTFKEDISPIIRHELTHRRIPWASERAVQIASQKKLPKDTYISPQVKKWHKVTYPQVEKAVKEYWKTGELGAVERYGMEVYELTPFRQLIKTEIPEAIKTTYGFGIMAVLKEIKTPKPLTEPKMVTFSRTETQKIVGIPKETTQQLTVRTEMPKVPIPTMDVSLLVQEKIQPLAVTGMIPLTVMEEKLLYGETQIDLIKQGQIQRTILEQVPETIKIVETESMQKKIQAQLQLQVLVQQQKQITSLITAPTKTIIPTIDIVIPLGLPPIPKKIMDFFEPPVYDVFVKKRQYVSGEKVYPTEYEQIGDNLSRYDAMSLGATKVGNTAKRTFKIKPSEGPRKKSKKKVSSWFSIAHQFNQKSKNVFVEKVDYAINSPGELEEITMKGIAAQRRKGPTTGTDYPKTSNVFVDVDIMVDKQIMNLLNKKWRI